MGTFMCSLCERTWEEIELDSGQQDCPACGASLYSASFTEQLLGEAI